MRTLATFLIHCGYPKPLAYSISRKFYAGEPLEDDDLEVIAFYWFSYCKPLTEGRLNQYNKDSCRIKGIV